MKVIEKDNLRILKADEGKHIRLINDVYVPEHYEDGELIEEHFPYYAETIYLSDNFDIDKINETYIEEEKDEEN